MSFYYHLLSINIVFITCKSLSKWSLLQGKCLRKSSWGVTQFQHSILPFHTLKNWKDNIISKRNESSNITCVCARKKDFRFCSGKKSACEPCPMAMYYCVCWKYFAQKTWYMCSVKFRFCGRNKNDMKSTTFFWWRVKAMLDDTKNLMIQTRYNI